MILTDAARPKRPYAIDSSESRYRPSHSLYIVGVRRRHTVGGMTSCMKAVGCGLCHLGMTCLQQRPHPGNYTKSLPVNCRGPTLLHHPDGRSLKSWVRKAIKSSWPKDGRTNLHPYHFTFAHFLDAEFSTSPSRSQIVVSGVGGFSSSLS